MKDGFLKKAIASIVRPAANLVHRLGWMTPQVIVRVDGGVSSQMQFYLLGDWMRRNRGIDVAYDLIWFKECGTDIDGRFARNFDLLRLCPDLKYPMARNNCKTSLYRLLYKHIGDPFASPEVWQNLKAPTYMDGYYRADDDSYFSMREVFNLSPIDADDWNARTHNEISNSQNAVGMHVRRGDLTREVPTYGLPASTDYFKRAAEYMQSELGKDTPFYIFSDEPEWVKTELLPILPQGNYIVLQHNGSDKGYLDLWLISACRHFITSTGSFGKFGAMLSSNPGIIILPDNPENAPWKRRLNALTL